MLSLKWKNRRQSHPRKSEPETLREESLKKTLLPLVNEDKVVVLTPQKIGTLSDAISHITNLRDSLTQGCIFKQKDGRNCDKCNEAEKCKLLKKDAE